MVTQYRSLYLENRSDTLESLDSMPQLKHVHNLKAKILFSIIVVSRKITIVIKCKKLSILNSFIKTEMCKNVHLAHQNRETTLFK